MDRFLAQNKIVLRTLQLVGLLSLLIASKLEEEKTPSIDDLMVLSSNNFSVNEIRLAEHKILNTLDFKLGYCPPSNFMRYIRGNAPRDLPLEVLTRYLMEVLMVDHHFLDLPPSLIASSCMYFCCEVLKKTWVLFFENHTFKQIF
jgi:hypothetical protein